VNAVLVILVSGTLLAAPGAEPNGSLDRAIALYRQGEFAASVALLQAARQAAPDDAETRLWLGKALLRVQKWNEAATELERAVALQPSNSRYHLHLGLAYGDKAMHASKLFAFGIARKVRDEFEAAVRVGPDDFEARSHLLEFYLEAPGLVGGGKDKARALVEQTAARSPMRGFLARARLLRDEKKWDLARAEYEAACKQFPGQPEPQLELAEYLIEREDARGALASAERALELAPRRPQARLLAAAAHIRLRTALPDAERELKALARGPLDDADPSFAEVYYWLGRLYVEQSNTAAARDALETALRFDPDHAAAKKSLSEIRR
jgi:tetratricopeptide (TPR) repeat protein